MRLFVAIELSAEARAALSASMDYLRMNGVRGSFTHSDNLHMTLAFIGESENADGAVAAIKRIASRPFDLALKGHGFFGDILWAGVKNNPVLDVLAEDVCRELRTEGFRIEHRKFVPHITLVRGVSGMERCVRFRITEISMTVRGVSLMRSDRVDGRLVYSRVYRKTF